MKRNLVLTALLGLLITGAAAFAMPHGGGPYGIEKLKAFSELPADKQKLIVDTFSAVKEQNADLRDEIKATHEKLRDILTAENFDAQAYKETSQKLQTLMTQGFTSFNNAIAELAPQLTQSERQILVQLGPGGGHFKN
ncbi:MAG TPA: periplasmic heavy metal sensor [Thermodesulfobacteriota bacterium]|nr:periplasmic heavy metal sensor [Thermodesulfobacteriota bacterium]